MHKNQDINVRSVFTFIRDRGFVSDSDLQDHFDVRDDAIRGRCVNGVVSELETRDMIERTPREDKAHGNRWRAKITENSIFASMEVNGAMTIMQIVALFNSQSGPEACVSRVTTALFALGEKGRVVLHNGHPPRYVVASRKEAGSSPN